MASGPSISYGSTNTNSGAQVGVSNGTINVFQERTEPRPDPLLMIPFPRDPDFVGRKELLDQIQEKATVLGSRIAAVGIGGIGKTQLAVEYCHQARQQSVHTWVFWVHASNAARCEKSLRDIANRAKIPGHQDSNANVFQLVGNWLQDGNIGKWILVLDNVDDDELLRKPATLSSQPPLRKLLEGSTGTIIVTSRNRGVALDIVGHTENIVDVYPMDESEALDLLQKKLSPLPEHDQRKELAQELEYMPLAIVQAAGYIQSRLPRCSISQYLLKLRKSDREAARMLREEAGLLHRDWEAKNSILLTWQISFDYIRSTRSSAADLLSLMSFFDRQGIAENILRAIPTERTNSTSVEEKPEGSSDDTDSECSSSIDASLEKDFMLLSDFSLISFGNDDTASANFTMHRLVQLTVRTWLKVHGHLEQWKEKFIEILDIQFPTGRYENWETCRSLFPHVKAAVLNRPKSRASLEQWAHMLYRGAWYAHEIGYAFESREMASLSRDCRLNLFGEEDRKTLSSIKLLASICRRQGQWKESEQLIMQVLDTRKRNLGKDHRRTMKSMASLASTLSELGRWEEARQLQVQILEHNRRNLGESHRETLRSMGHLASTLSELGRWEEAKQLEAQVLRNTRRESGESHPDTLTSMAHLASTLSRMGWWGEAEQLERQVLEHRRRELGESHPDTLTSMAQLASTISNMGRWGEAEQLEVQVLEKRRLQYGMDHHDTLSSMGNLALTLRNQSRWKESEQLEIQVLEKRRLRCGMDHPDTLNSMGGLALSLRNQGRWEEAEQLELEVLEKRRLHCGINHPDTLTSMGSLALTLRNQGRWQEAESLQIQVLEARKLKLGEDHPNTLKSMGNLASMLWDQGRFEESEKLARQVFETRKTKLGLDHPETLTSMSNLAYTLRSTGQNSEAINLMRACFSKRQKTLGLVHPDTKTSSSILMKWETQDLAIDSCA